MGLSSSTSATTSRPRHSSTARGGPARRWLGLTATPYRRDELDDLMVGELGPVRHTMSAPEPRNPRGGRARRGAGTVTHRSPHDLRLPRDTEPVGARRGFGRLPGGELADEARNEQVVADVVAALARGRSLPRAPRRGPRTWTFSRLRCATPGTNSSVLKGGMGAGQRREALARLGPGHGALLVVATGHARSRIYCPALDTLFLASPIACKGAARAVRREGSACGTGQAPGRGARLPRRRDRCAGVRSLRKRATGYTSLGFPERRHHPTPAATADDDRGRAMIRERLQCGHQL